MTKHIKSFINTSTGVKDIEKPYYHSETVDHIRQKMHPLLIKHKFNKKYFADKENFLRLHLGCGEKHLSDYINIDFKKTSATDFVCDYTNLSFPSQSVELIKTYYMIEHLSKDIFSKALHNWWDILIPGGKLIIKCHVFDKTVEGSLEGEEARHDNIFSLQQFTGDIQIEGCNFMPLKRELEEAGYAGVTEYGLQNYHNRKKNWMEIQAYKKLNSVMYNGEKHIFHKNYYEETWWPMKKEKRAESITLAWREKHIFNRILHEHENLLYRGKKAIDFGCGSGELDILLGRNGHFIIGVDIANTALRSAEQHKKQEGLSNIQFIQASLDHLPFSEDSFDSATMIEVLEHIDYSAVNVIFKEFKRVLKPQAKFFITVPNKFAYGDPSHVQIFTKGLLAQLLDNHELAIQWLTWERRRDAYRKHDMLTAMCTNKPPFPKKDKKVCALGHYSISYDQLGFHWDGQIRAFKDFGYDSLFLDIRKDSYENLRLAILNFRPDILWLGLKECLLFIEWMEDDIKKLGCTVVYWFCDLRGIEGVKSDLPLKEPVIDPKKIGNILDYIFLSNAGQIEDYKLAYETENVFYMGRSCSPNFHRRVDLKEEFDIAFAGGTDKGIFHKGRTKLIKKLSRRYNLIAKNNVRNNIAEFYSSSKMVFGADVISENVEFQPYLYTSNRFFIALGCGAFLIHQWFPGIEKLAENHKHLVWFKTERELFELIDYYLEHDEEREQIRKNAQTLAHSKHTYLHRIQNMMDIIEGKTSEFYGFLDSPIK